ncbi:MAG: two-component system CheB/CheR fusion protein [Paraglaciecola sp.]|jgi:two-component system CheB/CheR fusion protein
MNNDKALTDSPGMLNSAGFPIVGIGASAGGLAAFEAFFSGMPADIEPGMAFVLVQHLAPDHKSILTELIRRYTRMQVFEVEDGMVVNINCAYIIPPGHDMAFLNGSLQLLAPAEPRGQRLPIDFFFRSLAQDQYERAIGIVLSGTGSDGTAGVRAIKDEGGMVMAQNIASTEFDGMPYSALSTGLVDFELPPAEMAPQLIAYVKHAFGTLPKSHRISKPIIENVMKKIFILVRAQTGHDFSQYKPSTIHRRIDRRMAVQQIEDIEAYLKYLQQTPAEIEALFRDLLIGVTNFFRDPDVFQLLEEQVIPQLFKRKSPGSTLRVWTTGCSTGEEAYSLAILMVEHIESLKQNFTVQVFATDINSNAIGTARMGVYPVSIANDMSAERLARFFTLEADGSAYRIHKSIRDLLVFSEQDVIKDPPFSKLDFISCRNLLIYMGPVLQKKIIPLFHYALNLNGWLFLGSSEGIGEYERLFSVVDRKAKVYQRKEYFQGQQRIGLGRFLPSPLDLDYEPVQSTPISKSVVSPGRSLRDTTVQALLNQVIAAGVLVNNKGDVLYLHGRTGMFLEPAQGEAGISNILKMARQGLHRELTTALHRAVAKKEMVFFAGLKVKTNGHFTSTDLTVLPVTTGPGATLEVPLFLVILEEAPTVALALPVPELIVDEGATLPDAEMRIAALKAELSAKEEYLQSTNEELESSSEELKSSNEEMQSVNEELQSTNEELETSKEELQSVNEELATVNTELQTKVTDLSQANNDMNNLLAGTGIGTVFVDHQLRIMRYTPAASSIINLILSDVGRPVAHIVSNLVGYSSLVEDVQAVLETLLTKSVAVQTIDGKYYTMRIQPYRTLDNVIEGAVISFIDTTDMVQVEKELDRSRAGLRQIIDLIPESLWIKDGNGKYLLVNEAHAKLYSMTVEALTGKQQTAIHSDQAEAIQTLLDENSVLKTGAPALIPEETDAVSDDIPRIYKTTQIPFQSSETDQQAILGISTDITESKHATDELRLSNARMEQVFEASPIGMALVTLEGMFFQVNQAFCTMLGRSESLILAENFKAITDPEDIAQELHLASDLVEGKSEFYQMDKRYIHQDGHPIWTQLNVSLVRDDQGEALHFVAQIQDISERKQTEETRRK